VSRVAVHVGAAWVRLAVADPRPQLLAALPVGDADPYDVLRDGLAALLDRAVDELVVVHAAARPTVPPCSVAAVRAVPAAVAALGTSPGPAVVVDVGHSDTEITRVSRGRVVATSRVPVGGAMLDEATADLLDPGPPTREVARRPGERAAGRTAHRPEIVAVRETLSLQPSVRAPGASAELSAGALHRALIPHLARVVDGVRAMCDAAGTGRSPPVLLIGGVARAPLLAELLDAAGLPDVRVADRPDSAAVVGALRLPPELLGPPLIAPTGASGTMPGRSAPAPASTPAHGGPAAFWLPPVAPSRRRPVRGLATAAVAAAALSVLHLAGSALPEPGPAPLAAAGELVQYGYAVRLPAGWVHTGGLPERRRSLLTPVGAPDGGNLISVERTPLGYDADAEPQRARSELRAEFARATAGGARLTGLDDAAFAGRSVVVYRESGEGSRTAGADGAPDSTDSTDSTDGTDGTDRAQVDWYVVLDGDAQLSIGCRHTTAAAAAVAAACATVVGSVRRTT